MSHPSGRQDRELLDAALDGALDQRARERFEALLRADPALRESFEAERRMLAALKDVTLARDLTGPILEAVQARRAFLGRAARMRVWGGRVAIAAGIGLAVASIAVLQRVYPNGAPWSDGPGPVAAVESRFHADAAAGVRTVSDAVSVIESQAFGPLGSATRQRRMQRPELPLGDTSVHTRGMTYRVAIEAPSGSGGVGARQSRAWGRAAGVPGADEGFVVSTASWTGRPPDRRALRSDWQAGGLMHHDDGAALERSWCVRFWTSAQPAPGQSGPRPIPGQGP